MSSRRFEGWREALDALGEYIGEGRREVLRAEAMRLDLLDWKEMGRKLDEMGRSPRMALFCLHRGGSSWGGRVERALLLATGNVGGDA